MNKSTVILISLLLVLGAITYFLLPSQKEHETSYEPSDINVKVDSASTKTFRLKNVTSETVTILNVKSKDPQLSVVRHPKKVLKPGEETRLIVSLKPHQTGYVQGELELATSFKPSPIITLGFNAVGK